MLLILCASPAPFLREKPIPPPTGVWIAQEAKIVMVFYHGGNYTEDWYGMLFRGTWVLDKNLLTIECTSVEGNYPFKLILDRNGKTLILRGYGDPVLCRRFDTK